MGEVRKIKDLDLPVNVVKKLQKTALVELLNDPIIQEAQNDRRESSVKDNKGKKRVVILNKPLKNMPEDEIKDLWLDNRSTKEDFGTMKELNQQEEQFLSKIPDNHNNIKLFFSNLWEREKRQIMEHVVYADTGIVFKDKNGDLICKISYEDSKYDKESTNDILTWEQLRKIYSVLPAMGRDSIAGYQFAKLVDGKLEEKWNNKQRPSWALRLWGGEWLSVCLSPIGWSHPEWIIDNDLYINIGCARKIVK